MDFNWVKRKDCKVLLQDSTLVGLIFITDILTFAFINLFSRLFKLHYKS